MQIISIENKLVGLLLRCRIGWSPFRFPPPKDKKSGYPHRERDRRWLTAIGMTRLIGSGGQRLSQRLCFADVVFFLNWADGRVRLPFIGVAGLCVLIEWSRRRRRSGSSGCRGCLKLVRADFCTWGCVAADVVSAAPGWVAEFVRNKRSAVLVNWV